MKKERVKMSNEEIRCVCERCDRYMDLFKSLKDSYYRCKRFPRCNITANPKKAQTPIEKHLTTELISSDAIKIYRLDASENDFCFNCKNDKKILSSVEEGI